MAGTFFGETHREKKKKVNYKMMKQQIVSRLEGCTNVNA